MFTIQEIFEALKPILDTSLLTKIELDNYLIDSVNHFGFTLDYPEGITIYYHDEHFHLWKTPGDDTVSYDDILSDFLSYIHRLMNDKILFIYSFRGKIKTRVKIVEYNNEESVIEDYVISINPFRLLLKKKEIREVIEFIQR